VSHPFYFHQITELRIELDELRTKERGLCELLEKTEEELKTIKSEVFQLFVSSSAHLGLCGAKLLLTHFCLQNTSTLPEIRNVHGQMKNDKDDLQTRYHTLVGDYNKLIDENRTLCEIKNDTISAIEIFKNLQEESTKRERLYQSQIAKLTVDKSKLHKDRSHLTKQLLSKHRDMIILNSEIDKFREPEDYESM
jgi:chromosome segregation ATPase